MRLIHTSDWHLGATLYGASREDEHRAFLRWLAEAARTHEVDAIVVAGDVFEHAHASAEAHRLFYEALSELAEVPSVRQVVVVAGNHDSAARIEAPRALLERVDVHVVGHLGEPSDHLIPIGPPEAPVGVVAALPFVHEYRLGVRSLGRDPVALRDDLEDRLKAIYDAVALEADARFAGLPLVGTGHLTLVGTAVGEGRARIHLSRLIEGVGPRVFGPRYDYVALGHIHIARRFDGDRIAYSGTPIPIARDEARTQRYVELATFDGRELDLERLEVPLARQIIELRGTPDELRDRIATLRWRSPLPPFVHVTAEVPFFQSSLAGELAAQVDAHPRGGELRLLRVEQVTTESSPEATRHELLATPLSELSVEQVFDRLYETRFGAPPPADISARFASLLSADPEAS